MSSFDESVERIRLLHEADELAELRRAAESRPPAPAWTSEPPKVAGWHLYRPEGEDYPHATWVNLKHLPKLPWAAGLWYGPIPEPPA